MEDLIGFFAFLALAAISSGLVGLILAILLRRRVRELELTTRKLASSLRALEREFAAPTSATPPLQPQPVSRVPATPAPPPTPALEAPLPKAPAAVSAARIEMRPAHLPSPQKEDTLTPLETIVGTRWLNWIGSVVVLVGVAFLLKYLYDRGWIGPAGRVGVGLAFGVGLLFIGEVRLRRVHDLLSQSVSAAGCGALFLTTFLAYKFYDFSGRLPTFALLCWFAGFTVSLAVVRQGRVLAYLGLLGAYLTPYLLSTGQDQAEALFSYLAVVALAGMFVSAARGWPGIALLSLVLSLIYYSGWYSRFYSPERLIVAAVGAGCFIVLMEALSLVRGLWNRSEVNLEECIVILGSGIIGLSCLWITLIPKHSHALGFVLCGLALAALAGLRFARRRRASNEMLESTLLGFAAGSLLLVIPACLEAAGAMLAWALAAVILAELAARPRRWVLELAAAFSLVAALIAGIAEPVRHSGVFHPIINRVFVAWFGAVLAWFIAGARFSRCYRGSADRRLFGAGLQVASCFMMLALLSYETAAWFAGRLGLPGADASGLREWRTAALCLLWALYPAIWLRWTKIQPRLWNLAAAHYLVMGFALLSLLPVFHHRKVLVFLNPVFLAAVLYPVGVFLVSRRMEDTTGRARSGLQVYGHVLGAVLLAVELHQGLFLPPEYAASRDWIRMAFISAAWAGYATVVLFTGISRNLPAWRWLALSMLGVTLVKVLLIDMAAVRQIWRVLSFLVLGALLMACSYAYSRHERRKKPEGKAPE